MSALKSDFPAGWVLTRLGELYDFEYGKSLTKGSRAEAGRYPVYGSSGVVGTHDQFLVEGPAIIVGRKGAAGSVHYSMDNSWPIDTTYYVRGDKNLCLKLSYYLFRSLNLAKLEASTAIPGLNRNHAYDETVSLPPLREQHRIVAKIDELFSELDKGIENLKTARAQLKVYRQALLKHAFEGKLTVQWRAENQNKLETADALLQRIQLERAQRYQQQLADWEAAGKQGSKPKAPKPLPPLTAEELAELPELPEGWGWEKNENYLFEIKDGTHDTPKYVDNGIPFVTQKNIKNGKLTMENVTYISTEDHEKFFKRSNVQKGDLIISMIGHGRGECCLVDVDTVFSIKNVGLFKFFRNLQSKGLLKFYFQSTGGLNLALSKSKGGAQPFIGLTELRNWPVPVCSQEEQLKILDEVESRLSVADQLDQTITISLQQAEALRQSILKKAFSGQLVPQDPHDEPASKLLARIQAERAENGASDTKQRRMKKVYA